MASSNTKFTKLFPERKVLEKSYLRLIHHLPSQNNGNYYLTAPFTRFYHNFFEKFAYDTDTVIRSFIC
jgi:hypothetical protein